MSLNLLRKALVCRSRLSSEWFEWLFSTACTRSWKTWASREVGERKWLTSVWYFHFLAVWTVVDSDVFTGSRLRQGWLLRKMGQGLDIQRVDTKYFFSLHRMVCLVPSQNTLEFLYLAAKQYCHFKLLLCNSMCFHVALFLTATILQIYGCY